MFCANCGAQLAEGVRFCPDCGTSVGTAASTAVGQVQPTAPAASPGMGEYVDRWTGFALDRPPGWVTRVTNGVVTVLQDAGGLVGAFFWPVRVLENVTPITIAQQFVSACAAGNPTFKAWLAGQQPVIVRTEAQSAGRVLSGLYSVVTQQGSGMIAGFQAPREQAGALAPVLGQVVGSFKPAPAIPRQLFREPAEGAFTVLYPQGWAIRGGVNRGNAFGAALPSFLAAGGTASADNGLTALGFTTSAWQIMPGQQKLAFMPAAAFAQQWLPGWLQKQSGPLRVEQVTDRPDQLPQFALELAKAGISPDQCDLSAATLQYAQDYSGRPFRHRLGVLVQRLRGGGGMWGMGSSSWTALITSSIRAPAEEFDQIEPVLTGVLASYQKDPQWEQAELMRSQQVSMQMQQQSLARLRQVSQTLSQTTDIINSTYWARQASEDRISHNFSNALRGRTDVVDSQGTTFSVPNDSDQYWRSPDRTIIGTGWLVNPDPTWERLEPVGSR